MSVRAIADGSWGFASSAELGRGAVEATAARASDVQVLQRVTVDALARLQLTARRPAR